MLKVEVLGPGCAKCNKLHARTAEAITASGVEAELIKVEEVSAIMAYGVAFTPALVIDGEVVSSGGLPAVRKIVGFLTRAAAG